MASGDTRKNARVATGTYTCTGSAVTFITGFKPAAIEVLNTSGICIGKWNNLMPDAAMCKVVDSGVGTTDISYVTSNGITPTFNGFTLGADADLNVNTEVIFWTAWR